MVFPLNPYLTVGSLTANPSGPSDIHGGAFTLMFETKIKYDGYGVLASKGDAGDMNKAGGHSIVLEAGAIEWMGEDQLLVSTRLGDIYLVDGVLGDHPQSLIHI